MGTHPEVLLAAAATLAVAAASLAGFGLRHSRRCVGWRWWASAIWLAALGVAIGWASPDPVARLVAECLLLQWPLTTLLGLRRLHARDSLPGHALVDLALLGAGTVIVVGAAMLGAHRLPAVAAAVSSALLLHTAALLRRAPVAGASVPLQALALALSAAAIVSLAILLSGPGGADPLPLRAVAAAISMLVCAFAMRVLIGERGERGLRESRRGLRALAGIDALTQVPNRRHFHELATLALARDAPGSAMLLMFDVDHLKALNDTLGHAAGDRALKGVAGGMLERLRAEDVAGRHGGDEFALLLRRADQRIALDVAARVAQEVQRRSGQRHRPCLSLSSGMVQVRAGEPLAEALRRAEQALLEAKRRGRSRAVAAEGSEASPVFAESQRLGLTPA